MESFEKIVGLDDEVQAEVVDSLLSEQGIPHVMKCYHDTALDGIFQALKGWGHIEAPSERRDEILAIVEGLKGKAGTASDDLET
jgi:hypothetical protein